MWGNQSKLFELIKEKQGLRRQSRIFIKWKSHKYSGEWLRLSTMDQGFVVLCNSIRSGLVIVLILKLKVKWLMMKALTSFIILCIGIFSYSLEISLQDIRVSGISYFIFHYSFIAKISIWECTFSNSLLILRFLIKKKSSPPNS